MIRFNSLKKKPKIWNVAVLSAIELLVLFILVPLEPFHRVGVLVSIMIYLIAVIGCLIHALIRQLRYNPYSYNTIYYIGFSFFLVMILIVVIYALRICFGPNAEDYSRLMVIGIIANAASRYWFFTAPFILVFSVALFISNISLIRHEGKRLVNLLGIILSVMMVGTWIILYKESMFLSGSELEVMIMECIINMFSTIYLYFECMLLGTIFANIIVVNYKPDYDQDYIIILGCGLMKDGMPTPLLRGRCDRAIRFAREQEEKTGKSPIFITSGGQGPDEVISESQSMTNYLISQGIPESQIRQEDRSTDTYENMRNSKEIIMSENKDAKMLYSTTNFHVFRSGIKARRVKMKAIGIGQKTAWYFWPNASVREFIGILTEHRLKQGLILGGMVAFFIITTILSYKLM